MSEHRNLSLHCPQLSIWSAPSNSGKRSFLYPKLIIDGEWPRLELLNKPLRDPLNDASLDGCLRLQGNFRNAALYQPHRDTIKSWFPPDLAARTPKRFPTVVFTTARFIDPPGDKSSRVSLFELRPSADEIFSILPQAPAESICVVVPPGDSRLRTDYIASGLITHVCSPLEQLSLALHANFVVCNESPIHWWAGFLSPAPTVALLTYGDQPRLTPCQRNSTFQIGRPNLRYSDATTRLLQLRQ